MCDARCHVVDLAWTTPSFPLSAAKHSCQQLQDGARLHGSRNIRPYHPLPTDSSLLHSSRLTPCYNNHHNITAPQHRTLPASSFARTISIFIHPSTLRIPLRRLTSARYTTLPPSAAVSPVHQSPLGLLRLRHARRLYTKPYRLAGDTRPSPARQIPNEHLTSLSALNIHTLDSYLPPTPPIRTTTTPHRPR